MNQFDQEFLLKLSGLDSNAAATFKRPMSFKARKLLYRMFEWSGWVNLSIFGSQNRLLQAWEKEFNPIEYEDACHRFDVDKYPGELLKKYNKNPKVADIPGLQIEIMGQLKLKNLHDPAWLDKTNLKLNVNRVSVITNPHTVEIYNWLTTNFLANDFSEMELNKISEMGAEQFSVTTIKREASAIEDIHKHSVSYLYAIVRDVAIKESITQQHVKVQEDRQKARLKEVLSYYAADGIPFKVDDDQSDKLERTRAYMEVLDGLKNNE